MPKYKYQSASSVVKVNICKCLVSLRSFEHLESIQVKLVNSCLKTVIRSELYMLRFDSNQYS